MRNIDDRLFTDSFLCSLTIHCRWFWVGLLVKMVDDQGRCIDDPAEMRIAIFPTDHDVTPDHIDKWLDRLASADRKRGKVIRAPRILRYRAGGNGSGRGLIQILNWWKYQDSAAWAAPSKFPAPPKWIDRVRVHHGHEIVLRNWELAGGFDKKPRRMPGRRENVRPTQGQGRPNPAPTKAGDDIDPDIDTDSDNELIPPSGPGRSNGKRAERMDKSNVFARMSTKQRKAAETTQRILTALALRNPEKVKTLSGLVAMRSLTCDVRVYVLAAIASAYANPRANDKTAMAVHYIENDQVDPHYMKAREWRVLPDGVLRAAGVENLSQYQAEEFQRG